MPINARNASRNDQVSSSRTMPNPTNTVSNGVLELNNAQTEEEKINALFNLQANQWKEQQQEMANATPVPLGRGRGKPINVPDHPPPPGYLCYRCREKGHWIQACPTNNDPKFDGKYRVKRSTGIPRSLQTKVEKPESLTIDGSNEDLKNTGVMVNADGDFVIAKPDKAAWELYQEKAKASAAAAAEAAAAEYSKELQARGLECPIDKRMFLEPTKTPCCQRTYCNDCITNALIESDFVCPGCGTEGVLLDNLSADDDAVIKIKAYETEKVDSKKEKEKHSAAQENQSTNKPYASTGDSSRKAELSSPASPRAGLSKYSKKRPAEDGPLGEATEGSNQTSTQKKQKAEDNPKSIETSPSQINDASSGFQPLPFGQQMHFGGFNFMQAQGIPSMAFPDAGFAGEGTGFMNSAGLASSNAFTANISQTWNPMGGMNFNALSNGLYGDSTNGAVNSGYGATNMFNGMGDSQMNMFPIAHMAGGNIIPEYKGGAAHTIPEECERLFCDTLSVIFLGERIISGQESLGAGAYQIQPSSSGYEHSRIQEWIEVLDYTSDCIYRGFMTSSNDERTLFIFFRERALGQGLKTGYVYISGLRVDYTEIERRLTARLTD
ncbi:hypothetical protein APSETT444_004560 [Aspergillus pseudonomiae]